MKATATLGPKLGMLGLIGLLGAAGTALGDSRPASGSERLSPCADERFGERAQCGTMTVPEDPSRPAGRAIDLNVVVLRAATETSMEPVFMLAGGPGQAATDLAELALGPFSSAATIRDFVLVDQRGTGGSNRLDCATDVPITPASAFGGLFNPEDIAACLRRASEHSDVRFYSSRYAARDLEAVRTGLGYGKVLLWGASGGTRTALVYMQEFPQSVAGALLDGVAPTKFRAPSGFAPAAQRALDRVMEDCRTQAACRTAYPELEQDFAKVLGLFRDGPLETTIATDDGPVDVAMHRNDFAYTIRGLLYNSRRIAKLPAMIHKAARSGDLSEFAQAHWQRHAALMPAIAIGVHLAVYCAEDVPFVEHGRIEKATAESFLGDYLLDQYGGACDAWSARPESASFFEPVTIDVPVLLFSGYYDPSTPDGIAEETARSLPNSRHVVVRNEGHGAEFGCARQVAIDFLTRATLEGLEPACEGIGPIEFDVPGKATGSETS